MQRLKELQSLINLSRALNQEPDSTLLEEFKSLNQLQEKINARIKANIARDLNEIFSNPTPSEAAVDKVLDNIAQIENNIPEVIDDIPVLENEETWSQRVIDETPAVKPIAEQIAESISRQVAEATLVRPDPEMPGPTAALEQKIKYLEKWVSRIAATGPGSGEVNLRWLDDVDRSTITDDYYLRYEASTKKFMFDAGHKNNFHLFCQSDESQTSNATSATAMTFNILDTSLGIRIGSSNTTIILDHPGVYNVQFSSQFYNTGNNPFDVNIWLRQNNVDMAGTNGIVTVAKKDDANNPGKIISGWNYYVTTTSAGEYIQLMWWTNGYASLTMPYVSAVAATASSPAIPATASVILSVSPVKINSY